MQIHLDEPIYNYLVSLELLKSEGRKLKNSQIELSIQTSMQFDSGVFFARFYKKLIESAFIPPILTLDSLKEFSTPTARLYNWGILQEAYKNIGFEISRETKSQIVAGEKGAVEKVMKDLYNHIIKGVDEEKNKNEAEEPDSLILDTSNFIAKSFFLNESKRKIDQIEVVDLAKIDLSTPLEKTPTLLEFFIILVARNLNLNAKQAASLFTRNSKYMAHILIKGLKGQFEALIAFYQEIYQYLDLILERLERTKDNKMALSFLLQSLKPGFASKSFELAHWTAQIFSKLSFEFLKRNLDALCWEWFVSENGGLLSTVHCLKRHPELKELILKILLQVGSFNFAELFTTCLKKTLNDPQFFFSTVGLLIKPLSENRQIHNDLFNSGVLDYWIDYFLKIVNDSDSFNSSTRLEALNFMVEIWMYFPEKIENNEEKVTEILNYLKHGAKEQKLTTKISCITNLFRLFEHFGNVKKYLALLVYKTLTNILIESQDSLESKDFLMRNMITIFQNFDSIPLNIVLDPLIKSLQSTESINGIELEFFSKLAYNPKITLKNVIQILDLLAKVFLNNLAFSHFAMFIINNLLSNHISNEAIHDFLIKLIKIALAILFASERKRKKTADNKILINKKPNTIANPSINEKEVLSAQKRNMIVELLRQVLQYHIEKLNKRLAPLIAHTILQIKTFSKKNHKGLMSVLSIIGNADDILQKYDRTHTETDSKKQDDKTDQNTIKNTTIFSNKSNQIKSLTTELISLKTAHADPKVLQTIDEKQKKLKEKIAENKMKEELEKKMIAHQKANLRKHLELRRYEEGVEILQSKDLEVKLIYPFNTKNFKSNFFEFVDLKHEENREVLAMETKLREKQKILKFLFLRYSNTGFNGKAETFEKLESQAERMTLQEINKMISEIGISKIISLEEIARLVRLTNRSNNTSKISEKLDFSQFQTFFLQLSFFLYSEGKLEDLRSEPLVCSFERCLELFKERKLGVNVKVFDDIVNQNSSTIKELTKNLNENPDYVLPEGFKKVVEKKVAFQNKINSQLINSIPESYTNCYHILDDLMFEKLKFHIIEPLAEIKLEILVKNSLSSPAIKLKTLLKKEVLEQNMINDDQTRKSLKKPLSLVLQSLVSQNSKTRYIDRYIVEECAHCLEDILDEVSKIRIPLKNRIQLEKIEFERKNNEVSDAREKKRKQRHQLIKKELKDASKTEKQDEKKREQQEREKKKDEEWKTRFEQNKKLKEKIAQEKQKEIEEKERKKQEEEPKKIAEIRGKKKKFQEFNSIEKKKLQEKFTNMVNEREEALKKKKDHEEREKTNWKLYNDVILPKKFEEQSKLYHIENSITDFLNVLKNTDEISLFFSKNEKTLKSLFEFLVNRSFTPLNFAGKRLTLNLEGLSNFSVKFNICPTLINLNQIILIYKSLTKVKAPAISNDTVSIGLDYNEFCQCFLRIAVKANSNLNVIGSKLKEAGTIILEKDLQEIINKNLSNDEKKKNNEYAQIEYLKIRANSEKALFERTKHLKDEYKDMDNTNIITLTGLLYYLGLPLDQDDKKHLEKRLREIDLNKSIPNKLKKKDLIIKLEDGIRYKSPKLKNEENNLSKEHDQIPSVILDEFQKNQIKKNNSFLEEDKS